MQIEIHSINDIKIAEVILEGIVINRAEDGFDLLANLYYQDFDKIILHEKNITPDFFDLKNGMAGELLQKFSNYRIPLAIVGDFTKYKSKSMIDFIYESNKGRHINFVPTVSEAIKVLSNP
ncbi:MAG: alpha/beta hydrolase [Chitinophagaceae bacterium]|nr:alpha/beta hydrolase [Chitinophagaceae bacterium]